MYGLSPLLFAGGCCYSVERRKVKKSKIGKNKRWAFVLTSIVICFIQCKLRFKMSEKYLSSISEIMVFDYDTNIFVTKLYK